MTKILHPPKNPPSPFLLGLPFTAVDAGIVLYFKPALTASYVTGHSSKSGEDFPAVL
jgi:hypothetical protein